MGILSETTMKTKSPAPFRSVWFAFITAFCLATPGARAALTPDQEMLATANTGFAFKLLREIAKEQLERNIFISPHSASTVLQIDKILFMGVVFDPGA